MKKSTLSSLTIAALFLLIQYPSMAGNIKCQSISRGDRRFDSRSSFQGATLANSGDGYDLSFNVKSKGAAKYKVTSKMIVLGLSP
jgi:hypothetical protein